MKEASHSIASLRNFIKRFDRFSCAQASNRVAELRGQFRATVGGLKALRTIAREMDRQTGQAFNIFHVLGVQDREVKTHSALLAELLDPDGSHAHGDLFLRKFFAMLSPLRSSHRDVSFPIAFQQANMHWQVNAEKVTAYGRLDLVFESPSALMVIENKIYAQERSDQLERYAKWLRLRRRSGEATALLFLTRKGDASVSNGGEDYYIVSYDKDIRAWIMNSLPEVQAPRLRDTLMQYLDLTKSLVGDRNGQI